MITATNYLFLWSTSERSFSIFLGGGGFNHFQALTDEKVHAWLYHNILLMGGFYQVRVRQKITGKQHNIIGSHKCLIDAVVGGRHYCRNYYQELFCVVAQHKVETLTKISRNGF